MEEEDSGEPVGCPQEEGCSAQGERELSECVEAAEVVAGEFGGKIVEDPEEELVPVAQVH